MLEVLYSTGIRVSELSGLSLEDLDLQNAELKVHGKGGKERVVPLGEAVRDYLERYLARSRPVLVGAGELALFVSNRGRRFHYTNVSFIVRGHGARAGIAKHVSPHGLRHYAACGISATSRRSSATRGSPAPSSTLTCPWRT